MHKHDSTQVPTLLLVCVLTCLRSTSGMAFAACSSSLGLGNSIRIFMPSSL